MYTLKKLCLHLSPGDADDAVKVELATSRDGPVAGDVCDRTRLQRSSVYHDELVHTVHTTRSYRSVTALTILILFYFVKKMLHVLIIPVLQTPDAAIN